MLEQRRVEGDGVGKGFTPFLLRILVRIVLSVHSLALFSSSVLLVIQ